MKKIRLKTGDAACPIILGGSLETLPAIARRSKGILIADAIVHRLHARIFPDWPVIEIAGGEAGKTLHTAEALCRQLLELGADRSTFIVGIGGGVTCDLTGFVAATYMRGIPFALAPSTLLAQADAAIGGKNGVDLDGYKNVIGTFRQPEFVLSDFRLLATLPREEILCGLAEIIKAAAIADRSLFDFLEKRIDELLCLEPSAVEWALARAVRVKTTIVSRDEKETGERRLLNFGHTLGHALEKVSGIGHGRAIAIGMAAAGRLSVKQGLLPPAEANRLEALIHSSGLDVEPPAGMQKELANAIIADKKRMRDRLHLVLLAAIGRAIVVETPLQEVMESLT